MNRISHFLSVLSVLFISIILTGCSKDGNPVSGDPPHTGISTFTIEGQVSYKSMSGNTLEFRQSGGISYGLLGSCIIDETGNFRITAKTPDKINLGNIKRSFIRHPEDLYISDTTVNCLTAALRTSGNDGGRDYEAYITWNNKLPVIVHEISSTYYEGAYCFFDKDVIVQGTVKSVWTYSYNFKAKAGWNILLKTSYHNYIKNEAIIYITNMVSSTSGRYLCTIFYNTPSE